MIKKIAIFCFFLISPLGMVLFGLAPFLIPLKSSGALSAPFLVPPPFLAGDLDQNGLDDALEMDLAKRFNPAMVLNSRTIWPVDHSYLWAKGGALVRRIYRKKGNLWRFLKTETLLKERELEQMDWSFFPSDEKKDGQLYRYKYYIDGPGKNLGSGPQDMTWASQFTAIQGGDLSAPTKCVYPPTQYVHFYWEDWNKGLLVIQYWFYYPYNKFINSHEGDWEHINVYLALPVGKKRDLTKAKVKKYRYYFHKFYIDTETSFRLVDPQGGQHGVVFVGGQGGMALPNLREGRGYWKIAPLSFRWWGGFASGASYPWPGTYTGLGGVGPFRGVESTGKARRILYPEDFRLVILPEPDKINYKEHPELSWLHLNFYSGDWMDPANNLVLKIGDANHSPLQPGQKNTWNGKKPYKHWKSTLQPGTHSLKPPNGWKLLKGSYR